MSLVKGQGGRFQARQLCEARSRYSWLRSA